MTIQVIGILIDPMKVIAPNVTVRVIATDTSSDSVPMLPAKTITGSDGSYGFELGNGKYSIVINFSSKYNLIKEVTITNDTISPITLSKLLNIL